MDRVQLKKEINRFRNTVCADAKAPVRVKAVNTMLNSGHNLDLLKTGDLEVIWEAIFFAIWYAEMGKGCEEIIEATARGCNNRYELTQIGFRVLAKTWFGLDQHRVDKVTHLARHLTARLIHIQIKMWFDSRKKTNENSRSCKPLIQAMLMDIKNSIGLSYFVIEIFVEEFKKALQDVYVKRNIYIGHAELKSKLLSFIYKQFFMFIVDQKYDYKLLRTIDIAIFKAFIDNHLTNESQMVQILVTLRFKEILDQYIQKKRSKNFVLHRKIQITMRAWSDSMNHIHESCISGEYFPDSLIPRPLQISISKR